MKKLFVSLFLSLACAFLICGHADGTQSGAPPAEQSSIGALMPTARMDAAALPRLNLRRCFTTDECEYLRERCNFTPEEMEIFDLRVRGCSIVEIQMRANVSEATIYRRLAAIKQKIYRVL